MLSAVRVGSGGSIQNANGKSKSPPAVSCQAVKVSSDTGGRHFRLRTVPAAMDSAPPRPAAMPTGSRPASGPNTSSATPPIPPTAARTEDSRMGVRKKRYARKITIRGWTAPTVAATPPGSR